MKLNSKYKISLSLIIAACFILVLVWRFWDEYGASEIAVVQKTPDWQAWKKKFPEGENPQHLESNDPTIPEEKRPAMFIRTDSTRKALLLRHNYADDIYLYDSETKSVRKSAENDWLNANGSITSCRPQATADFNLGITIKLYPHYQISRNGKTIETYGKYALFATESMSRTKMAVLSASGPVQAPSSGYVGLGGSDPVIYGQMYIQIMLLDKEKYVKEPVRVESEEGKDNYRLCWSNDEKYVVVYKPYADFSVVETNLNTN